MARPTPAPPARRPPAERPGATAARRQLGTRRRALAIALVALMALGSISLWLVIPVAWIYAASQLQDGVNPTFGPYLLIIFGVPISMAIMGKLLSRLNRTYGRVTGFDSTVRVQLPWHRSMRGERDPARPRSVLDVVMVISVALAGLVFALWFFFIAGSSLPT